ncbi:hypothetical protein AAEJ74_02535 [Limnospira fusiformis PMC 851.14]|uniref:Uncharacterized protein n=1 Tax=Limnospira fusiformis PMC 851.14 TaxID=2219512 RepID=A0ABU9EIT5_LIMFS
MNTGFRNRCYYPHPKSSPGGEGLLTAYGMITQKAVDESSII